jgi:hypothetical protein
MPSLKIRNCPGWSRCPVCRMAMVTLSHSVDEEGRESCLFECLKCGHRELSEPALHGR